MNCVEIYLYYLLLLLSLVLFSLVRTRSKRQHSPSLPPGPPRDAFIGNLRLFMASAAQLDRPFRGETFHEWAKTHGDVMYLEVLGRKMLILDSLQAANDLLDKRGSKYSGRPRVAVFDMIGWEKVLGFLPYGEDLHVQRGMIQRFLRHQECRNYEAIQTREALRLIWRMLNQAPETHPEALQKYPVAVIMKVMYGHELSGDHFIWLVEQLAEALAKADSFLADCFPSLARLSTWFPYSEYRKSVRCTRSLTSRILNDGFNLAHNHSNDNVFSSFVATSLRPDVDLSSTPPVNSTEWREHVKNAAGMCYWAASDTVYGTLMVFILAMTLHPECQRKAQDEIDKVVGRRRLPSFDDRPHLPYTESILRETLRWKPVAPTAVPHVSTEDDIYRGMFIPKDTIVIPNIRGMTLDERTYKDPTEFKPERFLPKGMGGQEEPFLPPFGFGRRICPGRYRVENSLWIAVVLLLASFNIKHAVDENGIKLTPELKYTVNVAV
ncbi:cytochrome P450 [Hymenopellis radicata]|nr:cytochrome P450 [Hymenopellis radicata]